MLHVCLNAVSLTVFQTTLTASVDGCAQIKEIKGIKSARIVQELCENRGGRPGLSVLTSLVSVDVKLY